MCDTQRIIPFCGGDRFNIPAPCAGIGQTNCVVSSGQPAMAELNCTQDETISQPMKSKCACTCAMNQGCYQQPERVKSFKPSECYQRPTAPMESNTVYTRSYYPNNGLVPRIKPVRQIDNLKTSDAKIETHTIQTLSYQGHCGVRPPQPIRPPHHKLDGQGPMESMTTQKHDFVPKPISKRQPLMQVNQILRSCAPVEKNTINRLSFMPVDVCKYPPPKPIIQGDNNFKPASRSSGLTDSCTIQKLSYLPICPLPKENLPWVQKTHHAPPPYPCDQNTTYGLSYMPNCPKPRAKPMLPIDGAQIFGCDIPKADTVYKLSYMNSPAERPRPFLPQSTIYVPTGPTEKCTIYKLSYQQNCVPERAQPIRPQDNVRKNYEPMELMTTQMRDFVPKPFSKPRPMMQGSAIPRECAPLESNTINRLSFMPIDVCKFRPARPFIPVQNEQKSLGPVSDCTTYKLSYMPCAPLPKEPKPWVNESCYVKPTQPMETCTIQKLSYLPPGKVLQQNCKCSCNQAKMRDFKFPRAGICN